MFGVLSQYYQFILITCMYKKKSNTCLGNVHLLSSVKFGGVGIFFYQSIPQIIDFFMCICQPQNTIYRFCHKDVIKWKHLPRYWPYVRGIHRSQVNSYTKASDAELWCFLFICAWTNVWVYNRNAGDLRRHRAQNDVIVINLLYSWLK